MTARKIATVLKEHGLKMTPQRRAVLKLIAQGRDYFTPATLHERVKQEYPGIGIVTIYRTIEMLSDLGLICCVYGEGNYRSYVIRRPEEHHHHLVCSGCNRVVEFTDCDIDELEQRLSQKTGFVIESHLLEVWGRCPDCRRQMVEQAPG
jgi:Fur family ferric uptake transcriptional regulator